MLLPLSTDRPLKRPTTVTFGLIALNVIVFLVQQGLGVLRPDVWQQAEVLLWLDPLNVRWWGFVSYAFLHAGVWHIAGNMLFLWVFGPNIEDRLGRWWFLVFYLLGAAAAGAAHAAFFSAPVVGASGAIAACTGAYLVMFPRTIVKVFNLLFLSITWVPAWWVIGFAIAWDIFFAGGRDRVAHLAHLGGYVFGAGVAAGLLATRLVPTEPYDLFTMGRQAYRRRQLAQATLDAQQRVSERVGRAGAPAVVDPREAQLLEARSRVSAHVRDGQLAEAAKAYRALADEFGNEPPRTCLSRQHQYELANYLYQSKDSEAAAYAYERFIEAYPRDPEVGQIRLLLGLIYARSFNDPTKAKTLLTQAIVELKDEQAKELARRELAALG